MADVATIFPTLPSTYSLVASLCDHRFRPFLPFIFDSQFHLPISWCCFRLARQGWCPFIIYSHMSTQLAASPCFSLLTWVEGPSLLAHWVLASYSPVAQIHPSSRQWPCCNVSSIGWCWGYLALGLKEFTWCQDWGFMWGGDVHPTDNETGLTRYGKHDPFGLRNLP